YRLFFLLCFGWISALDNLPLDFCFALQIGIYQLRSFVSDRFVLDFGSVNFDITTLNRYVLALCFDAFKTFDLRYWFFPW
ncbi:hypothetical protein RhiirA4_488805, partial [Rhizophagus irregularis]